MVAKKQRSSPPVNNTDSNRAAALQTAIDNITKQHGDGAVMIMGDKPIVQVDVISTASPSLDLALGVGGIPRGRITEIFGPEASGKTTLCLHLAASVHKSGGNVAIVDVENALDMKYAQNLGVDVKRLLLSQPEYGEQALEIVEELVRSSSLDLIVVDSIAALTPKAEIEGEMGDPTMGAHARLMSQAMRKLTSAVARTKTALVFTNQLRTKIGVMFGNPETTTGGNAMKFYASVRLDVRRIETLKDSNGKMSGNRTRIRVVKNKVASPFKETIVDIMYGKGIDYVADMVDLGVEYGVINKAGAWFSYKDERLGQGRDAAKAFLVDKPEVQAEILNAIKTASVV